MQCFRLVVDHVQMDLHIIYTHTIYIYIYIYIYIFAYRPHTHAPSNVSNMAGWELPKLNGSVKKNILKVTELYHCHA